MPELSPGLIYPRIETPLSRAGAGINYAHGSVRAIEVNFAPAAPYPDARLPMGRILHIGEGSPEKGDQRAVGGNRGMLNMMSNGSLIPTFERIAPNRYRYLGDFRVSGQEFGLLSPMYPSWRGFKFTLEPSGNSAPQLPSEAELGEFDGDIDSLTPPERIASIIARFKRSKAIVNQVKQLQDYRCQYCDTRTAWLTAAGVPYCEAHHVIPLGDDGFDTDANLAVLCAQCHRQIHFATDKLDMRSKLRAKLGI